MSDHSVTVTFEGGMISESMTCDAPHEAGCHAVWLCDCESSTYLGTVAQGIHRRPSHRSEDGSVHYGRFDDAECNIRAWFDADPDGHPIDGVVWLPVTAEWRGDYYEFAVGKPLRGNEEPG